ncbi:hypothetical protein Kpol_543p10 [Vanderwaltozyma polyspora DSM 70294]|uniref:Uncharacterized protein n=1 Tax=Vanderwaltozyma polyspora (strain ATCC 22028 / DSM 70294 / BCRC 21397 / CBS 2163 / NBRC 10782 / NRRL Y-8283 / UCD 57-17) TaxID=436907 RepID=A7THL5_VANPO|nr:uncharacterized protein Kpol_543p10 [Vanderwaltozyma polyspora DSM 70294]EDO18181.1 hypothetical protein Kpol_543p10 [Vanderwaltozyma polyspora DSM 70294]
MASDDETANGSAVGNSSVVFEEQVADVASGEGNSSEVSGDKQNSNNKVDEVDEIEEDEIEGEDDEDEEEQDQPSEMSSIMGTPIGDHGSVGNGKHSEFSPKKRKLDNKIIESTDSKKQDKAESPEKGNNTDSGNATPSTTENKKVPRHLLEKRRLGRLKAAEAFAAKLKKTGIERVDNSHLQQTGLFGQMLLVNQKNCSSDYLKKDDQVFALRERKTLRNNTTVSTTANTPDVVDLKALNNGSSASLVDEVLNKNDDDIDFNDPTTTIVIHPGSRYLKIGFAKDETPLVVPSCVAIPKNSLYSENVRELSIDKIEDSERLVGMKAQLQQSFRERMRYYKRKIQPNSHERVRTFNEQAKPEIVEDKNDHGRIEWINNSDKIYFGEEAERCNKENFIIRYPFNKGGSLNLDSPYYSSLPELLSDVTRLFEYALTKRDESITQAQIQQCKVILVIPDLFEKSHIETLYRILLKEMQFQAVAIMQESLAACYGAGISTASCIVNIGATQTTIACVDEGTVLENSLIKLDYGGDDITRLFTLFLLENNFPFQDLDLDSTHGWTLAEQLKKNYATFEDANMTVQLYNFVKRIPGKVSEKYEFKVFDEVILAPLALFYPDIFQELKKLDSKNKFNLEDQLPVSRDLYTDSINDWRSVSQLQCLDGDLYAGNTNELDIITKVLNINSSTEEYEGLETTEVDGRENYVPLEKAIIQSITNACVSMDVSKMNQFYANIMVVGGTSNIPQLDFVLTDRINIWRPKALCNTTFPHFFKNISKQVKEIQSTSKASTTPEEEEKIKQSIKELIETELRKYLNSIESQGNGDHSYPVAVLPPPRDMNPEVLNWKGASVLAQIKLIEELFVTNTDWDMLGSRILQYKCLFTY